LCYRLWPLCRACEILSGAGLSCLSLAELLSKAQAAQLVKVVLEVLDAQWRLVVAPQHQVNRVPQRKRKPAQTGEDSSER